MVIDDPTHIAASIPREKGAGGFATLMTIESVVRLHPSSRVTKYVPDEVNDTSDVISPLLH